MSVCIGTLKTLAISSLGIYTGILTTSTLLSFQNTTSIILSSLNIIQKASLQQLINKIFQIGGLVGLLSSSIFGITYMGSPKIWKHPYLLYSTCLTPLTTLYLYYVKLSIENNLRSINNNNSNSNTTVEKPIHLIGDIEKNEESIIDLGQESISLNRKTSPSPLVISNSNNNNQDESIQNTKLFCNSIGKRLFMTTVISSISLIQSIIGVYGEDKFC